MENPAIAAVLLRGRLCIVAVVEAFVSTGSASLPQPAWIAAEVGFAAAEALRYGSLLLEGKCSVAGDSAGPS